MTKNPTNIYQAQVAVCGETTDKLNKSKSPLKIESQSLAPGDSMISSGLVINSKKSIESSVEMPGACSMDPREDGDARIREFSSNSFALES